MPCSSAEDPGHEKKLASLFDMFFTLGKKWCIFEYADFYFSLASHPRFPFRACFFFFSLSCGVSSGNVLFIPYGLCSLQSAMISRDFLLTVVVVVIVDVVFFCLTIQ